MRLDILEREEEIREWISMNFSKARICDYLRCKPSTLETYLEKLNIQYSGNKGSKGKERRTKKSVTEYLQSTCIKTHLLRTKLLDEGIKQHQCEICGYKEWNGKPIPLELDHIDGNRFNNKLENLRVICPNCHAQTETNSGRNIGKYKLD